MATYEQIAAVGQKVPNHVLQSFMALKGTYKAPVDGDWGPKSVAAAQLLLSKSGLSEEKYALWGRATLAIAIEQLYLKGQKFYAGGIDGLPGPLLRDAQERWQNWLRSTNKVANPPKVSTATTPKGNILVQQNRWPTQAKVRSFFGDPGEHLVRMTFPYPMRVAWDLSETVKSTMVHEKVADSLKRILTRALNHYGYDKIKRLGLDLFGGCFNQRKMKGGEALSMHSWAIAIDIDPDHNQLRWGADRARMDNSDYDFFVQCFEDEGWVSLGRARNYDWMHFQAARL